MVLGTLAVMLVMGSATDCSWGGDAADAAFDEGACEGLLAGFEARMCTTVDAKDGPLYALQEDCARQGGYAASCGLESAHGTLASPFLRRESSYDAATRRVEVVWEINLDIVDVLRPMNASFRFTSVHDATAEIHLACEGIYPEHGTPGEPSVVARSAHSSSNSSSDEYQDSGEAGKSNVVAAEATMSRTSLGQYCMVDPVRLEGLGITPKRCKLAIATTASDRHAISIDSVYLVHSTVSSEGANSSTCMNAAALGSCNNKTQHCGCLAPVSPLVESGEAFIFAVFGFFFLVILAQVCRLWYLATQPDGAAEGLTDDPKRDMENAEGEFQRQQLSDVLDSADRRLAFAEFVLSQSDTAAWLFYESIETFAEQQRHRRWREAEARDILRRYVVPGAPYQVELSEAEREHLMNSKTSPRNLFNGAKLEIYTQLQLKYLDSFLHQERRDLRRAIDSNPADDEPNSPAFSMTMA